MFDNAIFASFIPQFLMVLGFISCIVFPSLSVNEVQVTPIESTFVATNISYQTNDLSNDKIINFAEHQYVVEADCKKQNSQNFDFPKLISIFYPRLVVHNVKTDFFSNLFSRPVRFFYA